MLAPGSGSLNNAKNAGLQGQEVLAKMTKVKRVLNTGSLDMNVPPS